MNALADALAVHSPPERPVLFRWPDALTYDLGLIGGGRLGWPADCPENQVPDWLVFDAMVRATTMSPFQLGQTGVGMAEEGFEEVDAVDLIEILLPPPHARRQPLAGRGRQGGGAALARPAGEGGRGPPHGIEPQW